MKTLYEGILADMEDSLKSGDNYDKLYKKAEKDYKKLISTTKGKVVGSFYNVRINSKELAQVLSNNSESYKKHADEIVGVFLTYVIDDACNIKKTRYAAVSIISKNKTIIISEIPYTEENELLPGAFDLTSGFAVQDGIKVLADAIANKYKTLQDMITAFNANITREMK